ncbi:MAG: DUF1566 domain-containing protein [Gammaproteobacteria bacterium]|nr:DUF1566 domain-containing protein [Gammaproteobacteria bacterium]
MKAIFIPVVMLLSATMLGSQAWAGQQCRSNIAVSTPTESFDLHEDGTVIHKDTGLMWMRCALGQSWDGKGCQGKPLEFTWAEAAGEVERINRQGYAGFSDWRSPVIPELASIVERHCFFPRVNQAVFPDTPNMLFWSGMERRGIPEEAYALDFGGGEAEPHAKSARGAVRLVRGGPWWHPPQMMPSE